MNSSQSSDEVFALLANETRIKILEALAHAENEANPGESPPSLSFSEIYDRVINGFSMPTGAPPSWIVFLESLSPNPAYALAGHAFFPEEYAPNHDVFYLEPWVGVVVITTWLLIPATGGYYRFRSADL